LKPSVTAERTSVEIPIVPRKEHELNQADLSLDHGMTRVRAGGTRVIRINRIGEAALWRGDERAHQEGQPLWQDAAVAWGRAAW
jgi:hypothetical protein